MPATANTPAERKYSLKDIEKIKKLVRLSVSPEARKKKASAFALGRVLEAEEIPDLDVDFTAAPPPEAYGRSRCIRMVLERGGFDAGGGCYYISNAEDGDYDLPRVEVEDRANEIVAVTALNLDSETVYQASTYIGNLAEFERMLDEAMTEIGLDTTFRVDVSNLGESEEIPDLDMDMVAPPTALTWQAECVKEGCTQYGEEYCVLVKTTPYGNFAGQIRVYTLDEPGDNRVYVNVHDSACYDALPLKRFKPTNSVGIRNAVRAGKRALGIDGVRESEQIPDLDMDAIEEPSDDWASICAKEGMTQTDPDRWEIRKHNTAWNDRCSVSVMTMASKVNPWQVYCTKNGVRSQESPVCNLVQLRKRIRAAKRYLGFNLAESEQIPDLDADPLHNPPMTWVEQALQDMEDEVGETLEPTEDISDASLHEDMTDFTLQGARREYRVFKNDEVAEAEAVRQTKDNMESEPGSFTAEFMLGYVDVDRLKQDNRESACDVEDIRYDLERRTARTLDMLSDAGVLDLDAFMDENGDIVDELNPEQEALAEEAIEALAEKRFESFDVIEFYKDIYGEDYVAEILKTARIDYDKAAAGAVSTDGWQHFLASYDGNSTDLPHGAVMIRVN